MEPVPGHQRLLAGQVGLDPVPGRPGHAAFGAFPQDRAEGGVAIADLRGELGVGRAGGQGQLGRDQLGQPPPADLPPGCVLADLHLPGWPGADPGGRAAQLRPQHDRGPGQPDDQVPFVLPGLVLRRRHLADQAVQERVGG
jgi:hypothetical protein